jgi:hypothetical protein
MLCEFTALAATALEPDALKNLSRLYSSILVAAISAPLSLFLSEIAFARGMIFRRYLALVVYWFDYKPRARGLEYRAEGVLFDSRFCRGWIPNRLEIKRYSPPRWWSWFYKPLGGCVYCFSTWIAIALFIALFRPAPDLEAFIYICAAIAWNSLLLDVYFFKIKSNPKK